MPGWTPMRVGENETKNEAFMDVKWHSPCEKLMKNKMEWQNQQKNGLTKIGCGVIIYTTNELNY